MKKYEVEKFAQYQADNWSENIAKLWEFDHNENIIIANGIEYTLNGNAKSQVLRYIGVGGTIRDFDNDHVFIQKAIDRKLSTNNKADVKIIYDVNTFEAKAIMSKRYKRVKNIDILNTIYTHSEDNIDENFATYIDDNVMRIGTSGYKDVTVDVGEVFSTGMAIWNSEVGRSSIGIQQLLYRLACTNGMLMASTLSNTTWRHYSSMDLMGMLTKNIQVISQQDINVHTITRAIHHTPILPQISSSDDRLKWNNFLSRYGITAQYHEGIVDNHIRHPVGVSNGVNTWGVYNAITGYVSNDMKKHDEAFSLLRSGYKILVM